VIAGGDHETSEQRPDRSHHEEQSAAGAARESGVQYSVADRGDELFILTDADGAIDFKIVTAPLASVRTRQNWRDLVPHRLGVYVIDRTLCRPPGAAWNAPTPCLDRDPDPGNLRLGKSIT